MTTESGDTPARVVAVDQAVQAQFATTVDDLKSHVRIPSVSWAAFDQDHVQASAEFVAKLARDTGFFQKVSIERARVGDTDELGRPAVLAVRPAKQGFPHVVLYAHHDVQPPGDASLWTSPAFEPEERDGRLWGRGTSDDKGGVLNHIACVRALGEVYGDDYPVGITLFIEGEEEYGSKSFENFLDDHREQLGGDIIVVADSDNLSVDTPALTVALRGNVTFVVELRTLEHASHSGMYGGAVPDAVLALVRLVSSFYNEDGSIAIAGLTTANVPDIAYGEDELRSETGLIGQPIGNGTITSRIWSQPAVTVTGIDVTDVANASNTLLPSVRARVSVRIAPGQNAIDAWNAIEQHVRGHVPFGAECTISDIDTGEGVFVPTDGKAVTAMRQALRDAWGVEPAQIGVGGSIPFIASLADRFPSAEILVTAVADPYSRAHSPDESLNLSVFEKSIRAHARFLAQLAE